MYEDDNDSQKKFDDVVNTPLYMKAMEIQNLVDHIVKTVQNTDFDANEMVTSWIESNLKYMSENSLIIPTKIAGAQGVDMYDLKMENATIIRKAAQELITDARGIQMNGFKDTEYLDLLRDEIEKFRILFAEWVKTFDPWDYIIDRWGLFNPPGVNYDDVDPDESIPFDPSMFDFFDEEEFEDDDEDDLDNEGFDEDFEKGEDEDDEDEIF